MKERIKNDFPMLVGILIAIVIIDTMVDDFFDIRQMFLKFITIIVMYLFFRFIEFRKKR